MATESTVIIGSGNVAIHLERWFKMTGKAVNRVSSRTFLDDAGHLPPAAMLYVISVSDDAIAAVGEKLKAIVVADAVVVHTSGSRPCEILAGSFLSYGVLYPMQTFSRDRSLDYNRIPLFIEGVDERTTERIESIAGQLSSRVYRLDSRRRMALHIAAVFACNYLNRLLVHAAEVLDGCPFSLETLKPLMEETIEKAIAIGPRQAQTGPARRGDVGVLESHKKALEHLSEAQELYSFIAGQILNDYGLRSE